MNDDNRAAEFIAAVREGLAELDRGEAISIESVETELTSWVSAGAATSDSALLSERALAEDWQRPEEDEAWSHLQS